MKNTITKLVIAAAALFAASAEAQIIQKLDYVGALSSNVADDWTKDWTNWTPKTTTYAAATDLTTLDGSASGKKEITSDLTLDASKVYLLKGIIVVKSGVTLTIPAGTLIRAEADLLASPKNYATLCIERGGKLIATGTATKPIVFTSNKTSGRERGDWGGVVICGKAVNNQGADVQLEGFNGITFDNTLGKFGGTDNNDNSGKLSYIRIEFAGLAFEPNKEVNSLTLGSVGKNTEIDHIQTSFGNDDAYEWFGGNVNCRYLISYKTTDDDFDTDFGYSGVVQNAIAARDTGYYDLTYAAPSGASTSESFESDNDAAGSGKMPYTSAIFSNITCIGPVKIGSSWSALPTVQKNAFRRGVRIRRNSRLSIVNSIFMGYRNFVMFDGDSTLLQAGVKDNVFNNTPSSMLFRNNLIINSDSAFKPASSTANGLVEVASGNASLLSGFDAWLKNASNSNKINTVAFAAGTVLIDPQSATAPNFRPVSATIVNGADYTYNRLTQGPGVYNNAKYINKNISLNVYPNPANDVLNIELNIASANNTIIIMDQTGRVVSQNNTFGASKTANINISNLPAGLYNVIIKTVEGNVVSTFMKN